MFLEGSHVLVEIEHARDCDFELIVSQVRVGGLEESCHKALDQKISISENSR
jgi:hypothetical protein